MFSLVEARLDTMLGRRPKTPLEERLGYRFRRVELLEQALTHSSLANERGTTDHSERLEFLGDAVLGLVAARWLYDSRPDLPEGALSKLKAHLVSSRALVGYARTLGVGEALQLGVGEERSGGRTKQSLLADALEAVFGAAYLDGGLGAAERVIVPLLSGEVEARPRPHEVDAKTRLQELTQGRGGALPEYRLVSETGPPHDRVFTVLCRLGTGVEAAAEGRSKKQAEQAAAAAVLARLLGE